MPWCDSCAKFWNPNTLTAGGDCPTCGHHFGAPPTGSPSHGGTDLYPSGKENAVVAGAAIDEDDDAWLDDYKAPWHFKLMVAMAAVYLVFRMIQMISWFV